MHLPRRSLIISGFCLCSAALAATPVLAQAPAPTPAPAATAPAAAPAKPAALQVKVGVLRQIHPRDPISIRDIPALDDGIAGANLAASDNNTTGSFLNQHYSVEDAPVKPGADPVAAFKALLAHGVTLVLADLSAADLVKVADAAHGQDVLIFNISAPDDSLRAQDCRANVIHVAPSNAMLADAVAQYLIWKNWPRWLLVKGSHPADEQLAQAYEHSAKKFGGKIVDERTYVDPGGGKRSDTGMILIQKNMPLVSQKAPDYDVLIAADDSQVFGLNLPYRTWDARPVAGSGGLVPTSWDSSMDQWGATQLQNSFADHFHREMNKRDYNAWVAMRMIGDGVTHKNTGDPKVLHDYFLGEKFGIAAYKGQRLSIRSWDQQLRQPILLSDGRTVVSAAPEPGFLHRSTTLDTLGVDKPESKCTLK
jgi:ABC transporter substrate binding protein (PQQ-dependent alcohol dehydrogenase system)